jgi:hypothetical protein
MWAASLLPLFGLAGAADALPITLTLDPSAVVLAPGQSLTVDIVIGGLVDAEEAEIALEAFELDLAFDGTRLQFDALSFGGGLGDPNDSGETFLLGPGNPNLNGVVEMGEFSLLSEAQLLALQSAPFTLATIAFTVLDEPGDAELELINLSETSLVSFGENLGDDLETPDLLVVTILPEPGAAVLMIGALALLRLRGGARS